MNPKIIKELVSMEPMGKPGSETSGFGSRAVAKGGHGRPAGYRRAEGGYWSGALRGCLCWDRPLLSFGVRLG